jgi:hypothetical protein
MATAKKIKKRLADGPYMCNMVTLLHLLVDDLNCVLLWWCKIVVGTGRLSFQAAGGAEIAVMAVTALVVI